MDSDVRNKILSDDTLTNKEKMCYLYQDCSVCPYGKAKSTPFGNSRYVCGDEE